MFSAPVFQAGTIFCRTAEELIPKSQRKGGVDPARMEVIAGFEIVTKLHAALG